MQLGKESKLAGKADIDCALDQSTRAVVSPDGWKLCLRDKDKNELYNLGADPDERHNLFYDNSHRDVIADVTTCHGCWLDGQIIFASAAGRLSFFQ
jgi:hypothetical protein